MHIPSGYANGFRALEENSKLLIFADYPLGAISDDQVRFDKKFVDFMERINIGITGSNGFIGSHLRNHISINDNFELVPFERKYFNSSNSLIDFVSKCDVVVHLAGMNRAESDEELVNTNILLTEKLVNSLESSPNNPLVIFSSSTQETNETPYGISKKECSKIFKQYSMSSRGRVVSLINSARLRSILQS